MSKYVSLYKSFYLIKLVEVNKDHIIYLQDVDENKVEVVTKVGEFYYEGTMEELINVLEGVNSDETNS